MKSGHDPAPRPRAAGLKDYGAAFIDRMFCATYTSIAQCSKRRQPHAEHIIMNFKPKAAQARLQAFYKNEWQDIPFPEIDTAFVFPLTYKIRDELDRVGGEVLGGVNHSKAFRVIVAYLAFIHKLKEPKRLVC
jgi:hypothetical protein